MSIKADILLVSPSAEVKKSIQSYLSSNGFKLITLSNLMEAFGTAAGRKFNLLIYDGSREDAAKLAREIRKLNNEAKSILLAEANSFIAPEELRESGISGCSFKPVREADIRFEVHRLLSEEKILASVNLDEKYVHHDSRNPEMADLYDAAVQKIAVSDSTVLILGESGTGKELMAKWIYSHSARRNSPLVKVSCAVLPEGVLESELFGHEKGSFTGAYAKRKGRFELADRGTIFLDEIGDIPPAIQSKFLRVLQEREFQRIGSNDTIKVDVRVIAATSRDLQKGVAENRFREDLYYRLNVISLEIPPLRDRREDIPALANMFCRKFCSKMKKIMDGFDQRTMKLLQQYNWPGNVRELENVTERAVVLSSGKLITADDLPAEITRLADDPNTADMTLKEAREKFEAEYIHDTIARFQGNVSRSSRYLGLARKNLIEKIKKYSIDPNEYRE